MVDGTLPQNHPRCDVEREIVIRLARLSQEGGPQYFVSAWDQNRTGDPSLFRGMLYQLSYPSNAGILP